MRLHSEPYLLRKKKKNTIPNKKLNKDGYTGVKEDRPGPQVYNPNYEFIRSKS